ncbi:MAG: S-formylglutathione hydrolase [Caulobacteraceae bacterium]|nr:S-formylglutathione hydrolase [Caulobacteraceae bacterium]
MSDIETLETHESFGGVQGVYRHGSAATGTPMTFAVFTPPQAKAGPCPVVYYLSGLTCTHANVMEKGEYRRAAAEAGLIVVCPDTSPRGEGVANDPAYDLGQGAGFYVDATEAPWAPHFNMYSYVTKDLLAAVEAAFPVDAARRGIFGHSMGGHGALTLALRHPDLFKSVSAFSPIVSPTRCEWGQKAFSAYLGADQAVWAGHDASLLIEGGAGKAFDDILIDQGLADNFLENQLKPELIEAAAAKAGSKVTVRRQAGYDHSYFFISTFMADHIAFHAERLVG